MKTKTRNLLRDLQKPAVLVLGIGSQAGLSIIRSLGARGITVIGIDSSASSMGVFSRHCASTEILRDEEGLYELLDNMGKASEFKNVIFCESDKYLLLIDKYKNHLQERFYLPCDSGTSLAEIMNKKNMVKAAGAAGLDIPKTFFPGETTLGKIKEGISYPCIVKPFYTQSWLRKKGEVVLSEKWLDGALSEKRFEKGYLVQEIIDGPETDIWFCIGYTDSKKQIFFTGHKIRQIPRQFGVATVAVSKQNDEIEKLSSKFLSHMGYSGIFEIEFKKDAGDGKYKFIEFNARICGLNDMVMAAGINLAYMSYCDALGIRVDGYPKTKRSILWISMLDDFITCFKYYVRDDKTVLLNWVWTIFKADSHAIFKISDLCPFVFNFFQHLPFPRSKSGYNNEKIY